MRDLSEFRAGKPGFYPDQSVYAEYACAQYGLEFAELDGGTGLLFSVASKTHRVQFGAGRCSWYPQNNATASTLASDKYFTNASWSAPVCRRWAANISSCIKGTATIARAGHERDDALKYLAKLGGTAFVKPLLGSRGDFAQAVEDEAALVRYLDEVQRYYDSVLIQPAGLGQRIPDLSAR